MKESQEETREEKQKPSKTEKGSKNYLKAAHITD
jgi:hypothetical protein